MSSNVNDGTSQADQASHSSQGPGSDPMKPVWIVAVGVYLVVVTGFVFYGLIKLWPHPTPSTKPPTVGQVATASPAPSNSPSTAAGNSATPAVNPGSSPSPAAAGNVQTPPRNTAGGSQTPPSGSIASPSPAGGPAGPGDGQSPANQPSSAASGGAPSQTTPNPLDPEHIQFFRGLVEANIYLETRLLLLVMLSGALGSLMHALRSLYWYTGNRMMVWSWVGLYILLPFTGSILATIFYFIVRGGFFSSSAPVETTSPFGFIALSALVGLFSPQATLKLKDIAETVFAKPGAGEDNKPQDSTTPSPSAKPAPTVTSVKPSSGAANTPVEIAGTNFANGAVVKFGGVAAPVSSQTNTSISVIVPANASATGPVDVQVTNVDGQSVTFAQGFTYSSAG